MRVPDRRWFSMGSLATTALALVLVGLAGRWFVERWEAVAATGQLAPIRWTWVAVAVSLLCVHAFSALVIWRRMLAVTRDALPWRVAIDVFTPTLLARYVPGRIWANAARFALAKRVGVDYRQTTGALLWEAGLALGTAATVAALTLRPVLDPGRWMAVTGIAVAALLSALLLFLFKRLPAGLPSAALTAVLGWLLFGAAHLAIARSIADVSFVKLPLVSGAMALGWSVGFLAIVVPLGFGVRDAVLLVVLSSVFDPGAGLQFVALARLAQLVADSVLTLAWLLLRRRLVSLPSSGCDTPAAPATGD